MIFSKLRQKKAEILAGWTDRTLNCYVSPGHFKQVRDRFANPVGVTTREALTGLFDLLCTDGEPGDCTGPLDQLLRIRSVQELSPSQAVAPVLELKWVARKVLGANTVPPSSWDSFDLRVERAALVAFDV